MRRGALGILVLGLASWGAIGCSSTPEAATPATTTVAGIGGAVKSPYCDAMVATITNLVTAGKTTDSAKQAELFAKAKLSYAELAKNAPADTKADIDAVNAWMQKAANVQQALLQPPDVKAAAERANASANTTCKIDAAALGASTGG